MSWLVPSACFDYLWLYSFFAPVPLPHFISLSVLSCLSHSAHIQKSPTGVHACVFVWLLVCACSSHGLFSSSLWLHIACFYHHCGQLHILLSLHASKNPLRRIRKQRSVLLQWGGNGISMHTVTLVILLSIGQLQPHMWSSRDETLFCSVAVYVMLHAMGSWQNVCSRLFTPILFLVLSRCRWSRKRVDYKERERECLKCST